MQQQQLYKNNGPSGMKYDYSAISNNLSDHQQQYVAGDGLWAPPTSSTSVFGQSNHSSAMGSGQIPSKTWGNFE